MARYLSYIVRSFVVLLFIMYFHVIGSFVINQLEHTMRRFILLASFIPIISALSGNLGLQTSANVVRYIYFIIFLVYTHVQRLFF